MTLVEPVPCLLSVCFLLFIFRCHLGVAIKEQHGHVCAMKHTYGNMQTHPNAHLRAHPPQGGQSDHRKVKTSRYTIELLNAEQSRCATPDCQTVTLYQRPLLSRRCGLT